MTLHLDLAHALGETFGTQLAGPPELKQDAILARLNNGVALEIRFAAPDAYALRWRWNAAELAIDTAPMHPDLATGPNHFHAADGQVLADPVTRCGAAPWDNLRTLVTALLSDPLLTESRQP